MNDEQPEQTCGGRAGGMEGFLWQVKDLLPGIWRGNGILALSGLDRVVLLPVVVGVEELLEPLNEVQVVLKSPLDELLHRDNLRGKGTGCECQGLCTFASDITHCLRNFRPS